MTLSSELFLHQYVTSQYDTDHSKPRSIKSDS